MQRRLKWKENISLHDFNMIFFVSDCFCCQCAHKVTHFYNFWCVKIKRYKNASRPTCNIHQVIQGGLIRSRAALHQGQIGRSILAQMWPVVTFSHHFGPQILFQAGLSPGLSVNFSRVLKVRRRRSLAPSSVSKVPLCSSTWGGNTIKSADDEPTWHLELLQARWCETSSHQPKKII